MEMPSVLGTLQDNHIFTTPPARSTVGSSYLRATLYSGFFLLIQMAPSTYIISRVADPIFAVVIGLGAAATRINREGQEKGRTAQQTIEAGKRRFSNLFSKPAQ
ncbi:hypothetical protein GGR54DRAFT_581778 [Hypoxylon sp. NC1633]|nr:hypothetical protein GGR54DRAFT_581778 [Hypoxylon sp. NC1633]